MDKFLQFIAENTLFTQNQPILLAVSGGKDSVLMTHLFAKAGFNFAIAHCNFQLRAEESDLDEKFVKDLALECDVNFFSIQFSTLEYARENQISIQMAARDLRYQWLEEIRKANNYSFLAVAHHQTDSVETVLLNLLRGTGIAGLSGISPKRDHIIRPLLAFTGKEVKDAVIENNIVFREDESNGSTKYKRNSIRLEVLPIFRKINPDLEKTFLANSKRFQAVESFLGKAVAEARANLFFNKPNGEIHIQKCKLQVLDPIDLWLYELFKPYGFTEAVLSDLHRDWNNGSGIQFFSSSHQIIVDRENLILKSIQEKNQKQELLAELPIEFNFFDTRYSVHTASRDGLNFGDSIQVADFDTIAMPLKIRSWLEGDRFRPLGMSGQKKISDFLISLKIPVSEKYRVPIVEDASNSIIAILPLRIDDRFKVTTKTKKVIIFEELKNE